MSDKEKKAAKEKIEEEKVLRKSQRAMWIAHILRQKKDAHKISDLNFEFKKVPVFLIPKAESFRPLVKLNLTFEKEDWELFNNDGTVVKKSEDGKERVIYAYLNSRISTVPLTAKGPDGEEEAETIYLFAPEAREFKTVAVFNSVQFFLGHTYLSYKQKSFGTFISNSLLVGVKYISPEKGKKRGYLADASSTIYTYHSSPLKRSANFLEGRAAATYKVKVFKDPKYRSRIFAGLGTINLFSLGASLGFSGLFGPNLGMRTEYYKTGVTSYGFEFQYMPYEFKNPLSERTFKLSAEWTKNLNNTRRAQLGLSLANHQFESGVDEITANMVSLYFGMSF